jgi:Domain of unknown function (DUF4350)
MSRTVRTGDLIVIGGSLIAVIALTAVSMWIAPPPSADVRGSSYASHAGGAKAAYLLLQRLGYDVRRSFEPAETAVTRVEPRGAVLVILSPNDTPSKQDLAALRQFLAEGGVVFTTGLGSAFLPGLTRLSPRMSFDMAPQSYRAAETSRFARDTPTVTIRREVDGEPPRGKYDAAFVHDGEAGVLTQRIGRLGQAIWWIGSSPLSNRDILEPGHLELLLNTLGPPNGRVVVWDEYYHGYARGFWSYLANTPLSAALAQLGVIAAAALFTFSRRRGPIRTVPIDPRASAMEFVEAMAALYRKARATTGAVETGRARLRRLLTGSARLPAGASDDSVANAAALRYAIDERELRDLLARSAAAAQATRLPAADALTLVQRMQQASATVRSKGARGDVAGGRVGR